MNSAVLERPMATAIPLASRRLAGRRMSPGLRKAVVAAHIILSVGWFGIVAALLILATAAATTHDAGTRRATYMLMEMLGAVIMPPAPAPIGALLTGIVLSIGTEWGVFKHWWIVTKLGLTLGVILSGVFFVDRWLQQMVLASTAAQQGANFVLEPAMGSTPMLLVYGTAAHLLMLGAATVISVFKPWGRTRVKKPAVRA